MAQHRSFQLSSHLHGRASPRAQRLLDQDAPGHCAVCGYDRTATPHAWLCPECGYPAYERYTDRSRRLVNRANRLALRHRFGTIEPAHLLAAIPLVPGCLAFHVLRSLAVDPVAAAMTVMQHWPAARRLYIPVKLPLAAETRALVGHAIEEAGALGHDWVGTEHLLLGLLRDGSGAAADSLRRAGATLDAARQVVRAMIAAARGGPPNAPDQASLS